ncbi:uncharacterized protein LOC131953504 isoform X2 [Physella acuta]|nr:uncharacterized protein LOC131953504 isoform X2 [Physella acuta]
MSSTPSVAEGILLGMGNPILDITVFGDQDLLSKYRLEPNNAVLAAPDQLGIFREIVEKYQPTYVAGGATQNSIRVAQWLLEVPHATTFFGCVGSDQFKEILEKSAGSVGVKVRYQVYQGGQTGTCAAVITGENRSLITELGAAEKFSLQFLKQPENWAYVEKAKFYYIGGFFLCASPESVLAVAEHSSAMKKTLVMNLHATFLCEKFADPRLNLLQHVDLLFGNGDEAVAYAQAAKFGTSDIKEIALKICQLPKSNPDNQRIVVFTQGKGPTVVARRGEVLEVAVECVDPSLIKDTNGCGDAFVGGFLSQLVQGKPLSECLRCAAYAAKVVIQHVGCMFDEHPHFI